MAESHLVVDGSNIATEGRSLPSLKQLLDAVEAVSKEFSYDNVTVIVDATFGHRIDASERDAYEDKINNGEIITPPAGVIGRGDAFILEVADRADAVVLSNDSFQEFHGTYDWLFHEGRLVGGKHVPGVGWIFLARSPVRGPTSRRAVSDAKRKRRGSKQAAKSKPNSKRPSSKSSSKKSKASKADKKSSAEPKDKKDSGRKRGGKEPEPYNEPLPFIEFVGAHPVGSVIEAEVEQFSSHGAYVVCDGTRCYISLKSMSDPPPRSARELLTVGETREFVVQAIDTPRRGIDLAMPGMESVDSDELSEAEEQDEAAAEEAEETAPPKKRSRKRKPEPAEAEAESVEEAPTAAEPALEEIDETKLSVSQRRKLRARRQAEAAAAEEAEAPAREVATRKRAPAKKASTRKKAATKRASTKKKATRSKAAGTTKAASKRTASKKAAAKKAASKKKAATKKRAPAKKTASKKAASKKAATKKAASKKKAATKKRAPAKKRTAKKRTAKKSPASKKAPAKRAAARKRSGPDGD